MREPFLLLFFSAVPVSVPVPVSMAVPMAVAVAVALALPRDAVAFGIVVVAFVVVAVGGIRLCRLFEIRVDVLEDMVQVERADVADNLCQGRKV